MKALFILATVSGGKHNLLQTEEFSLLDDTENMLVENLKSKVQRISCLGITTCGTYTCRKMSIMNIDAYSIKSLN